MEIISPWAGHQRTAAAGAAGDRLVSRQDVGEVAPGRDLALLPLGEVVARRDAGAVLLDVRGAAEFAAGHVRGAVSIGLRGRFEECAAAVLPLDRDIVLAGDAGLAGEATARLGGAGYHRVAGQLDDLASVLATAPDLVAVSSRLSIEQLAELQRLEPALQVVDVRTPAETGRGTLPGAQEVPLAILTKLPGALDRSAPVVVYSGGGYRSLVAASVLAAAGFADRIARSWWCAAPAAGRPRSPRRCAPGGWTRSTCPGE